MDLKTLFEMDWYERSPLTAVLKRNRGRWIHFTRGAPNRDIAKVPLLPDPDRPDYYDRRKTKQYQRQLVAIRRKNATYAVPKLGVNPKSMWQDPKGIYFYPVDWLLTGAERLLSGNQYGLDQPYFYIADLNLTDPNGINLDTITWADIEAIAKRNGWFEQMQQYRQLSSEEQKERLFSYARPDLPGSFFWHFIDRMVKDGKMTWSKAYRGVSFIRDPNLSIIHNFEPNQVLVLNPRIIKVIEVGENRSPIKAGSGSDSIEQWMHALMSIIKQVRGEYGGDLTWMKKKPTLTFAKGVGKFTLSISDSSVGMKVGLILRYTYGRAEGDMSIGYDAFLKQSGEQVVQTIAARVEQIAASKTDLWFTPVISIAAGKQMMTQQIADKLGLSISTTIRNDSGNYSSVHLYGQTQREIDRVLLKTTCHLHLYPAKMSATCEIFAGRQHPLWAQSDYDQDFADPAAMMTNLAVKAKANLDVMMRQFAPGGSRVSNPRFGSEDEATAFMGWLALNGGLSLNGELRKQFVNEIAAFESYPERRLLLSDIAHVMNSRW